MTKNFPYCHECEYASEDEFFVKEDGFIESYWRYFCDLAEGRTIDREDDESCPSWCPLLKEEEPK